MASFSSNLREFNAKYNDHERTFDSDIMQDWFYTKKTRMQSRQKKMFFCFRKTAVVLVGLSACGKSTFAKKFLQKYRGFNYVSFDDCTFEASREVGYSDVDVNDRALELLDEMLEINKNSNIIVDGLVVSVEKRAALMKWLHEMKYKIYVIYFTDEYNESHIKYNIVSRSVDHVLHARMVASNPECFVSLMNMRLNMLGVHAHNEGITEEEVVLKYCNDPMVREEIRNNYLNYEMERKGMYVEEQEKAGAFMWGADYYYEVR